MNQSRVFGKEITHVCTREQFFFSSLMLLIEVDC